LDSFLTVLRFWGFWAERLTALCDGGYGT
jgi:hypothetical protein